MEVAPALLPPPVDGAVPDGAGSDGAPSAAHQVRFALTANARRAACHGAAAKRWRALASAARGAPQSSIGIGCSLLAFVSVERGPSKRLTRCLSLQPAGLYECPVCFSWTARSLSRLSAHVESCSGPPVAAVQKSQPAEKRVIRQPWSAGPNAATFPSSWWAPATLEPGVAHETDCGGGCLTALQGLVCRCATRPAAFHFECLKSKKTDKPPPGALAPGWRCNGGDRRCTQARSTSAN